MNKSELFPARANEIHKNAYLYHLVDYRHCMEYVTIVCPKHGNFQRTPNEHLTGRGCSGCKKDVGRAKRCEKFLSLSQDVHGSKYDYSLVDYINNSTKVTLICPDHGGFKISPDGHTQGAGCIQCGFQKSRINVTGNTQEFISKAIAKHGMLYDYSKVNYTRNFVKVEIICPTHGSYFQTPSNHLTGKGCSKCQTYGYCSGIPGSFYILHSEDITKVGITNRGAKKRCTDIIKESGIPFQIICELEFADGVVPQDIEKRVLDYLRANYITIDKIFNGSTECFLNVDLHSLIEFLKPLEIV